MYEPDRGGGETYPRDGCIIQGASRSRRVGPQQFAHHEPQNSTAGGMDQDIGELERQGGEAEKIPIQGEAQHADGPPQAAGGRRGKRSSVQAVGAKRVQVQGLVVDDAAEIVEQETAWQAGEIYQDAYGYQTQPRCCCSRCALHAHMACGDRVQPGCIKNYAPPRWGIVSVDSDGKEQSEGT